MGRKQKLKAIRQSPTVQRRTAGPLPVRGAGKKTLPWIAGLALFVAACIGGAYYYMKARNIQPVGTAIQLAVNAALDDLNQRQGRFSIDEGNRLRKVLEDARLLAWTRRLDTPAASRLYFVIQVANEIIRAGSLETGELEKLETLVKTTRDGLDHPGRQPTPNRP